MLSVNHVSKRFGSHCIINDLSFQVKENTIYGFIGQNGAGKTTTMKMILGLYSIDSGSIQVAGEEVSYGQNKTNKFIGYLPDVPEFYSYMKPKEYLNLCGEITQIAESERRKRISDLLELVGLEHADKRIHGFSRGMKQRLGIAQALLNEPKLLICDEPTSALDPLGRKEILDILLAVKDKTTVIFSTHILSDVERICDEIGLLNEGKLAMQGTMEEIHSRHSINELEIEFHTAAETEKFLIAYPFGERTGKTQLKYHGKEYANMGYMMEQLLKQHIQPLKVEMCEPTLEALFMEVVGK